MRNRNRIEAGLAALALAAAALVANGPVGVAYGDEPCVPSDGTPAAFSEWSWASFTEWQTDLTPPADPDGQDGEDNPANLEQIGEGGAMGAPFQRTVVDVQATEGDWTEWTDDGGQVTTEENVPPDADSDTVRYVPAGTVDDATAGYWDNSAVTFYTWTGGNSGDAPPVYSDASQTALHPSWNPTSGNPQGGEHAGAGLYSPYETGNGQSTASWFLKAGVYVPGSEDTDFLWQKQVRTWVPGTDEVTHEEYRWSVYTRTYTPGTEPVVCGSDEPQVDNPSNDDLPVDNPPADQPNPAVKQVQPPATKPVVPTSIDAGL